MVQDDNYELMPHRVFLEMKKDMELLKRNPFGARTEEILAKINDLSKSLNLMVDAFKEANAHTQNQEVQDFSAMVNPINQKIDAIIEQNKKIAQGILAVADIAKDALAKTVEIEMKMQSSGQGDLPHEDILSRPLNVPMPPPSAQSSFMNQSQGQSQMPMPNMNSSPMPPPFPNQMNPANRPMQSGFGATPAQENKKAFRFYP